MSGQDTEKNPAQLERILDTLPSGEVAPFQAKVAIMVTLLEAVHASGAVVEGSELGILSGSMLHEFGLTDSEVGHLIEVATLLRSDAGKVHRMMERVSQMFSLDQKVAILSVVWRILMSDKQVDPAEGAAAVKIRKGLGLSMEAAVSARKQAEAQSAQSLMQTLVESCGESSTDE